MKRSFATVAVFCMLLLLTILSNSSCYYNKADVLYPATKVCDTSRVASYTQSVVPILSNYCYRCHGGSASQGNGIKLDNYSALKNYAASGVLVKVINQESGVPAMPKNAPKLDDCTITTIKRWVNAGALNN